MTTLSPEATVEINIELPDTLSELIKLASADIKEMDRNVFHPVHHVWYVEAKKDHCMGCLAGALIFSRLRGKVEINQIDNYVLPDNLNERDRSKMWALNSFRAGFIDDAINYMYGKQINIAMPDLRFLESPPNQGAFLNWDEMDAFLEWADQSVDIIARYEYSLINGGVDDGAN